jgi:intracellular sulfur oxidation DsrE/DsrF family protein
MKLKATLFLTALLVTQLLNAQDKPWVNPIIKNYGRVLDLPDIELKPDADREYKILIELVHDMENPKRLNFSANNVARLINLHAIGGVKPENLKVAVVVHGQATNSVVSDEAYQKKYEVESPYVDFYKELADAGVELVVCGQSLNIFGQDPEDVLPNVQIATSALTAVTTFQLNGYAYFKWD